ncbi:MAG: pteridine reductase [Methylococcales bacterium]
MSKCVLVTGAAKRIGAAIVRALHAADYRIILHFRNSDQAALELKHELNAVRMQSVEVLQADLLEVEGFPEFAQRAIALFGRVDALINNASAFYPSPLDKATLAQWDELIGCNLKAPFFLSLAFARELKQRAGTIVNVADIYGLRPLKDFSIYSISKAGLIAMTRSLARELAPSIRVNAVAPGAILWSQHPTSESEREQILARVPLKRAGQPEDIADAVLFLLHSDYITGQILPVDGGRSTNP